MTLPISSQGQPLSRFKVLFGAALAAADVVLASGTVQACVVGMLLIRYSQLSGLGSLSWLLRLFFSQDAQAGTAFATEQAVADAVPPADQHTVALSRQ